MMGRRSFLSQGLAATAAVAGFGRAWADVSDRAIETLRRGLKGRLILPGDTLYDAARRVVSFNPETNKRPRLIVRCKTVDDVVRAVEFARTESLDLAVRAGGHDVLGESVCENGVLIDLSDMNGISIDPKGRVARAQAGVRNGAFNLAAEPFGLAPVLGCDAGVGIAGLTLGGGIGWFLGTDGAACDQLLGARIVTADGEHLSVSADQNPDLFWALRGGGGNFGTVTSLDYRLRPAGNVLGGAIAFRSDIASFLRFYREFMHSAPDELAIELIVFPLDFYFFELPLIIAAVCWSGDLKEGERALAPLRNFSFLRVEYLRAVPFAHVADSPVGSRSSPYMFWRGASLDTLSDRAIDELAFSVKNAPGGWWMGLGHYMHGQITRVGDGETPFLRRHGKMTYFLGANWRNPDRAAPAMTWVKSSMSAMRRWSSAQTYINYLSDDRAAAVQASYGGNFERLRALKRKYDPTNVFHHNRNIVP